MVAQERKRQTKLHKYREVIRGRTDAVAPGKMDRVSEWNDSKFRWQLMAKGQLKEYRRQLHAAAFGSG